MFRGGPLNSGSAKRSVEDGPKHPEELLTEWRELVPHKSKVRIVVNPEEMSRLCGEFGNTWSSRVHHMNGNVYTVIENMPPKRYRVYDPVCEARGHQGGRITVPHA